jgi:hypothetical protein
MTVRQYVYYVSFNDGSGYTHAMGSIDETDRDDAIYSVWHDVLQFDYEDDDFDGFVMLYDTVRREQVYYYHG